jgi:hypothetical protein
VVTGPGRPEDTSAAEVAAEGKDSDSVDRDEPRDPLSKFRRRDMLDAAAKSSSNHQSLIESAAYPGSAVMLDHKDPPRAGAGSRDVSPVATEGARDGIEMTVILRVPA